MQGGSGAETAGAQGGSGAETAGVQGGSGAETAGVQGGSGAETAGAQLMHARSLSQVTTFTNIESVFAFLEMATLVYYRGLQVGFPVQ